MSRLIALNAPCVARLALVLGMASLCVACTTPRQLGDKALAAQKYEEALTYYDAEIEEGSHDPELFYNAAQASLNQGDLGAAERYYSRSLRYGGGVKVMRALAKLYIQTSNYARAAQVLYELLRVDPDQQTIYNNLGTALLYSGQYPKAESILLIAQQLEPTDPLPYLNLGVLYDRHLIAPARSAAFYRCYFELSASDAPNRALAEARSQELLLQIATRSGRAFPLTCGEAFVPGDSITEDERRARLEEIKAKALREDAQDLDEPSTPPESRPPVQVIDLQLSRDTSTPEQPIEPKEWEVHIRAAYKLEDCTKVTQYVPGSTQGELSPIATRMVVDCHVKLGQPQRAEPLLLSLLQREPASGDLLTLFELMGTTREGELITLCETYSDLLTLTALQKRCQALSSTSSP